MTINEKQGNACSYCEMSRDLIRNLIMRRERNSKENWFIFCSIEAGSLKNVFSYKNRNGSLPSENNKKQEEIKYCYSSAVD